MSKHYEKWKPMVESMTDRNGAEITAHCLEQEAKRYRADTALSLGDLHTEMELALTVIRRVCGAVLSDSAVDQLARVARGLPKQEFTQAEIRNRVSTEVFLLMEADAMPYGFMKGRGGWGRKLADRLAGYLAEVTE